MKDYTKSITDINDGVLRFLVTFILFNPGTTKLMLLKAIKIATNWGLKESKDFMDESSYSPVMFRKRMTSFELNKFKEGLSSCQNADYRLDDVERIRNRKLINLGLADKQDLVSEISELMIHLLFINNLNYEKVNEMMQDIISNIDEPKLKQIYSKYESNLQ